MNAMSHTGGKQRGPFQDFLRNNFDVSKQSKQALFATVIQASH